MPRLAQIILAFGLSVAVTFIGVVCLIMQIEPSKMSMITWFPLGIFGEAIGIPFIVVALFQYPLLAALFALALMKFSTGRALLFPAVFYVFLLAASIYCFQQEKNRTGSSSKPLRAVTEDANSASRASSAPALRGS